MISRLETKFLIFKMLFSSSDLDPCMNVSTSKSIRHFLLTLLIFKYRLMLLSTNSPSCCYIIVIGSFFLLFCSCSCKDIVKDFHPPTLILSSFLLHWHPINSPVVRGNKCAFHFSSSRKKFLIHRKSPKCSLAFASSKSLNSIIIRIVNSPGASHTSWLTYCNHLPSSNFLDLLPSRLTLDFLSLEFA